MTLYLGSNQVSGNGGGQAEIQDSGTVINNGEAGLDAIGVVTKSGQVLYDWIGTKEEYEAGIADGSIDNEWVCWITDDEGLEVDSSGSYIGSIVKMINTEEYVPEGLLYCDGAEYRRDQFEGFYDNYLCVSSQENDLLFSINNNTVIQGEEQSDIHITNFNSPVTLNMNQPEMFLWALCFTTGEDITTKQIVYESPSDGSMLYIENGYFYTENGILKEHDTEEDFYVLPNQEYSIVSYTRGMPADEENEEGLAPTTILQTIDFNVHPEKEMAGTLTHFDYDKSYNFVYSSNDEYSSFLGKVCLWEGHSYWIDTTMENMYPFYGDPSGSNSDVVSSIKSKLITCSYEEYQQEINANGFCDKIAVDSANQLFRVPTILNDGDKKHYIVVAGGSVNQSDMDWSAWQGSLEGKANKSDIPDLGSIASQDDLQALNDNVLHVHGDETKSGNLTVDGDVVANKFVGNLKGTADIAYMDGTGNIISEIYATKDELQNASVSIEDSETIVNNESSGLDAVGMKTKDGSILYDWIGTKEEYEAGIADGSISEDWVCWVTDEEGSDKYRSMPIGSVFAVNASKEYVPDGCLPCDGAEYNKSQFVELYDNWLLDKQVPVTEDWSELFYVGSASLVATAYGNGKFVAVGNDGYITTSVDGKSWTDPIQVGTLSKSGIAYGNGKFVAVGSEGSIISSTDGLSWTELPAVGTEGWYGIAYGNGKFVAVGGSGNFISSSDGENWTSISQIGTSAWYDITYGNGKFVAVGTDGSTTTSADGISWTTPVAVCEQTLSGVTYGNGKFVAVGGELPLSLTGRKESCAVTTSLDGVVWTAVISAVDEIKMNAVTYGNGKFVSVGRHGAIATSTDAIVWISEIFGDAWNHVMYAAGKFIAVGYAGQVSYKTEFDVKKSLLNTCDYDEYQRDLNTYGQCGKFGIDSRLKPVSSNPSLAVSGNYAGVAGDVLTFETGLNPIITVGASCLNKNGVISNFSLSTNSSGSIVWNSVPEEFIIKINTGSDIQSVQGIFGTDVSICISGGYLGCNAQSGNGIFVPIVQISQNQDIWIKWVKSGYFGSSSVQGTAYYSFTGAPESYIIINGSDYSTGGDLFNNVNIGSGYVGVGTSTDDSKGSKYPFLGSVDLNNSGYKNSDGTFTALYSASWSPSLNGLTVTGTPNVGDTINFEVQEFFRVPLLKDGAVIQQARTTDELGKSYNAGIPNIEGSYYAKFGIRSTDEITSDGCITSDNISSGWIGGAQQSGYSSSNLGIDASLSSSVYGNSDTVQMNAIALRHFVVVANGQINESQMDWSEWSSSLQGKANTDLSNVTKNGKVNAVSWNIPDYDSGIDVTMPFTAPSDGVIAISTYKATTGSHYVYINDTIVAGQNNSANSYYTNIGGEFLLGKGNTVSADSAWNFVVAKFFPMKGVN